MKRKNIFIACVFALSLFVTGTAVSYGATDQEICKESKKHFDAMVRNNGLLPGDEFNPYNYEEVANAATAMLANEGTRAPGDKNRAALVRLVSIHIENIETAAKGAGAGAVESAGHSLRFLTLSCKACHKVYETESQNRKMTPK
jgi:cytochrome c556